MLCRSFTYRVQFRKYRRMKLSPSFWITLYIYSIWNMCIFFLFCKLKNDSWFSINPWKGVTANCFRSGWKQRYRKSIQNEIPVGIATELCHYSPMKCSFISRFNDLNDPQSAERRTHTHTHTHTHKRHIDQNVIFLKLMLTVRTIQAL